VSCEAQAVVVGVAARDCLERLLRVCCRCVVGELQVCDVLQVRCRCAADVLQVCCRCVPGVLQVCCRCVAGVLHCHVKHKLLKSVSRYVAVSRATVAGVL